MSEPRVEMVVDARRLLCPMPVIRAQAAVRQLQPGQMVEILATDPGVMHDIPAWCRVQGHQYLGCAHEGRVMRLTLKV